jgi:hypothetical protein
LCWIAPASSASSVHTIPQYLVFRLSFEIHEFVLALPLLNLGLVPMFIPAAPAILTLILAMVVAKRLAVLHNPSVRTTSTIHILSNINLHIIRSHRTSRKQLRRHFNQTQTQTLKSKDTQHQHTFIVQF